MKTKKFKKYNLYSGTEMARAHEICKYPRCSKSAIWRCYHLIRRMRLNEIFYQQPKNKGEQNEKVKV